MSDFTCDCIDSNWPTLVGVFPAKIGFKAELTDKPTAFGLVALSWPDTAVNDSRVIIINENIDQTDWEYEQLRREYLWPTGEGLIIG